jgi:hypothetical protein
MKKEDDQENIGCVVPLHDELAVGTIYGILRQAKINVTDFIEKLKT